MSDYFNKLGEVTGLGTSLARVTRALQSTRLSNDGSAVAEFVRGAGGSVDPGIQDGVGTLAGAAAGAILWGKHRVLGAIGGASLGRNAPALLNPSQRREALCNMGVTGTAVALSCVAERHPVIGFVVGLVAAEVAVHYGGLRK